MNKEAALGLVVLLLEAVAKIIKACQLSDDELEKYVDENMENPDPGLELIEKIQSKEFWKE